MASSNKRKTTMAKLNRAAQAPRASAEKQAKKAAPKQAAADALADTASYSQRPVSPVASRYGTGQGGVPCR